MRKFFPSLNKFKSLQYDFITYFQWNSYYFWLSSRRSGSSWYQKKRNAAQIFWFNVWLLLLLLLLLLYFSRFVYVKSHIICIINGISRARNFINDTRCKRFNIKTINWLIIGTLLAWLRLLIENRVVCLLNRWENDRKCEMCISWIFMMTSGNRTEDV